jgi:hypothetical protein
LPGAWSAPRHSPSGLFAFMIMGDDRAIHATHVLGALAPCSHG